MLPSQFPAAVLIDPSFLKYDHRGENFQAATRLAKCGFPIALWSLENNDYRSGLKVIHPESNCYQLRGEFCVDDGAKVLYLHICNTSTELISAAKSANADPFALLNTTGLRELLERIREMAPQQAARSFVPAYR